MRLILLFALLGLGSGGLIAGLAIAVVATYRGAGVVNFATGGVAMVGGYAFWSLHVGSYGIRLSTPVALLCTVLVLAALGVLIEWLVYRPLRTAPPLAKLIATLALLLALQAAVVLAFGTTQQPEPSILPSSSLHALGSVIPVNGLVIAGIAVLLGISLDCYYRLSAFGLRTRAAAEAAEAASLFGLSIDQLSKVNAILATVIAGGFGVLAASLTQLDPTTLPLLVVPALAAALLAGMNSFTLAAAAGLGIGILDSLINYVSTKSWFPTVDGVALPGVTDLVVFVIVVIAIALKGRKLAARGEIVERHLPQAPVPQHLARTAMPAIVIGVAALLCLPADFRGATINSLIGVVMAASLVVIVGFVGQISVVQLALAGVGGFVVSHLAVNAGVGFPLAPLAAITAATVLGAVTAVSALRVRGVSLAIVTLAAAVAISNFYFANPSWGGGETGSPVPEPRLFGLDLGPHAGFRGLSGGIPSPVFGWFTLAVAVGVCLGVCLLRRGRLGQQMLAVRANERSAAAIGINVRSVKIMGSAIGASIAGLAGALYAYNFGSVSSDQFDPLTALSLIAFAYVGGITYVSGAVIAGLISTGGLLPYALSKWGGLSGTWFLLASGLLVIVLLRTSADGLAGAYRRARRRQPLRGPRPTRPLAAKVPLPVRQGSAES
jgi:branched-chain amino acid transport system permease protein